MAADELLLELAQGGSALFRIYSWKPTTLSLGYFQPAAERLRHPAWRDLPWLRRSTGGGAIVHDEAEVTYALALPPPLARQRSHAEWHLWLHELLVGLLRERGLPAELVAGRRPPHHELDFLCFVVPQPGDVVLAGRKIVGGAQRLRGGALLQHGSITPPAAELLRPILPEAVARALGLDLRPAEWTEAERQRIHALAEEKYRSPAWNEKR